MTSTDSNPYFVSSVSSTGASDQPVITGPGNSSVTGTSKHLNSFSHQVPFLSDADVDPSHDQSDRDSGEEGELSNSEVTEKNEEMNYRETVRAVRAFLGWTFIPDRQLETLIINLITHGRVNIPGEPGKYLLSYPPTIGSVTKWRSSTPEQPKAIHHVLRRQRDSRLISSLGLPRVSPNSMLSLGSNRRVHRDGERLFLVGPGQRPG